MKAADLQVGARVVIQDGWAQREAATVRNRHEETDNRPGFGQVFSRRLQNDRRARGAMMRRMIVIGLALVAGCASGAIERAHKRWERFSDKLRMLGVREIPRARLILTEVERG